MHWLAALAVLASGCDAVFGLTRDPGPPVDAAVEIDAPLVDALDAPVLANHDEDGDGRDDAIDVCPNIADAQIDGDGDGVGDLCDPHPASAIDRRYYFSSLQSFTGWTIAGGTWSQQADSVRVTSGFGNQLATLDGGFVVGPTVIAVIEQPYGPSGTGMDYGVMLATEANAGPFPAGVACYIDHLSGDFYFYDNRPTTPIADIVAYGPIPAVTMTAQGASDPSGNGGPPVCKARDANGSLGMISLAVAPVASAIPALYAFDGDVTFKSVFVVVRR